MKKYFFALALFLSVGAHAFEVSGNHFEGKFKIDSMTVGENEVTVNASSAAADVGQYGKVYVSYTFTQNPYIPNSGTWKGHGRGMSPDGQLQAGILMGVWTRDGSVFNMKSVDSVTDGINYVQGTMDVLTGNINLDIYPVK
ncbi:MAG: hypothetical protein EBW26_04285 [Proteobacteria bacterium]|jgi:hypothetical protein|nr:hypothetical protein [Pseudomonadota bacterium]NCV46031.1 hypothetical protein [Pseudomonadota bacterium]NCV99869.1 hypothetical protein [Pseudomonadota bacterium]NCW10999.1 hypothetical protein [Pseudomonadota bacterium]|tara:strand:- start:407 stop:829 length:423 start_codon:yes stop_codon:yes gene_type:complete